MGPDRLCHQIADGFRTDNGGHQIAGTVWRNHCATTSCSRSCPSEIGLAERRPRARFDPKAETITIPASIGPAIAVVAQH